MRNHDDRDAVDFFVQRYNAVQSIQYRIDGWLDERSNSAKDCECIAVPNSATAPKLAIEHTQVQSYGGGLPGQAINQTSQKHVQAIFQEHLRPMESRLAPLVPVGSAVDFYILPSAVMKEGKNSSKSYSPQEWAAIEAALADWLRANFATLHQRLVAFNNVSGIPFEFHAAKRKSPQQAVGFVFWAPGNHKDDVAGDIRRALEIKQKKFGKYISEAGFERILIIESQDMGLHSEYSLFEAFRRAAAGIDLSCYTQIWFMHSGKDHTGWYRRLFCLSGPSIIVQTNNQYQSMR